MSQILSTRRRKPSWLIAMAGIFVMLASLLIAPTAAQAGGGYPYDGQSMNSVSPYSYYYRNCTDYVAFRLAANGVPATIYKGLGNANQWPARAQARGVPYNSTPAVGAAAVKMSGTYGHVAYVEQVYADGRIMVSEYNNIDSNRNGIYGDDGTYGTRTGTPAGLGFSGFLHFRDQSAPAPGSQGNGVGSATYMGSNQLTPGMTMRTGQYIMSDNGMSVLILQGDGNLVLYGPGFRPVWNSGTSGNAGAWLIVQGDGNVVLYSSSNRPLWHTVTGGKPTGTFILQNDGNLVVYSTSWSALWNSGTGGKI